ncbi:hypothetical protein HU200_034008 [Digitaria exilis]|uniref:Uncharacterized protein n=1 Tax=Digitaria exilis TaxID=1010633 RepID=A0A835BVV4_9POAL|nr:hypothetical protein HU200_034008 [Digitaria exilis]
MPAMPQCSRDIPAHDGPMPIFSTSLAFILPHRSNHSSASNKPAERTKAMVDGNDWTASAAKIKHHRPGGNLYSLEYLERKMQKGF